MSGFVTHWATGGTNLSSFGKLKRFYVRRFGRVVITTYVAMLAGIIVDLMAGQHPGFGHELRCFLFVETWLEPDNWCSNGQTWTVAALLPSWILYPLMNRIVGEVERRGGSFALVVLGMMTWAVSFGPSLVRFIKQDYWLTLQDHNYSYLWPPAQIADFTLGVVTASLALRQANKEDALAEYEAPSNGAHLEDRDRIKNHVLRGRMADLSVLVVFLLVIFAPSSGFRIGWEPLFDHGVSIFLAMFLYGAAAGNGAGHFAKLTSHQALRGLGAYSFEVYLFQYPVNRLYMIWGRETAHQSAEVFMAFFLNLWLVAGLYAEFIEAPLVRWLRAITSDEVSTAATLTAERGTGLAGNRVA
eukprot:CAMPEP_0170583628 /NCGR_PEP_ID=MMETSP0224-20130122/8239_1 /TAXON_ID=285029 /ORGANISM="Togula jolla, Strain CCCM 725" /LENGTH=356 /DNA_ID=CAMNT_0010906973 /DNA_START=145 /DNA_END=1212 /DNA_ORIENTATION=-